MDQTDQIVKALNDLKAANLRLKMALAETVQAWPRLNECWVDTINSEPTVDLEKHRIRGEGWGGKAASQE